MSTVERARALAGYDEVSRLRQAQDLGWVLGLAGPEDPGSIADLGCGTGALLDAARSRWPGLTRALGVDGAPGRVADARRRLGGAAEIRAADLLALPPLGERFDLITSTSVLHWLYPHEDRVLAWVAEHLAPGGSFVLTTHHPHRERSGRGAEDLVAREALAALALTRPGEDSLGGVVPMGERARPTGEIRRLLASVFDLDVIDERYVAVRTSSAAEYAAFHASTFGTYFSRVVPEGLEEAFFREVGEAAWRRQQADGEVYAITVRAWRGRLR